MAVSRMGQLMLIDDQGKKYFVNLESKEETLTVSGIGVINIAKLKEATPGQTIEIAGRSFLLLEPSLIDILNRLSRGPQVILPKDGAQIIMGCNIGSGDLVMEIGAGTGSLTIMLASAVHPDGRVFSYEKNEKNAKLVKRNLKMAGLSEIVDLIIEDAADCDEINSFDAVITDLPEPWTILDTIVRALKPGGHFCAYVPNTNQVEMTIKALRERGFIDTTATETLQRNIIVGARGTRPDFQMLGHTGYLCFGRYPGESWPPEQNTPPSG